MKVIVEVKTKASQPRVEKIDEGRIKIWVKAVPEKGKANEEIRQLLADYFEVSKSRVRIDLGKTARKKLVEIQK